MLVVERIVYSRESLVGLIHTLQRGTLLVTLMDTLLIRSFSSKTPAGQCQAAWVVLGVATGMEDRGDQDQSSTLPLITQGNVSFTIKKLLCFV